MIAALLALLQALRSHLDLVSIGAVFIGSLVVLMLGALRRAKQKPPIAATIAEDLVSPAQLIVSQPVREQDIHRCFYGRNLGFRIESAHYAAHSDRDEPLDVIKKVRQRVAEGKSTVPTSWYYLNDRRDPHENQEKYLTVAFSVTQREQGNREVLLPNGWFMQTLDELALDLKRIQQMDTERKIAMLDSDDWMSQLGTLEVLGRKARAKLQLLTTLADLTAVETSQFDRLDNVTLLHEVEKLQQSLKQSRGEAR